MELRLYHLRAIVAISECGSINNAARKLGQSQPALAALLRRLEDRLGVTLFERTPAGAVLTPVGRTLVTRARAVLATMDELTSVTNGSAGGPSGLRIGGQSCPLTAELGGLVDDVLPAAQVQLRVDQDGTGLPELLACGALDIGLLLEPFGRRYELHNSVARRVLVEWEPAFVGMAAGHPLSGHDEVRLADLADADWLDDPLDGSVWPALFRAACAGAGFVPRVRWWTANSAVAYRLVSAGKAVAMIHPTSPVPAEVVLRPLRGDPIGNRVVLLWRRPAAASARRLWPRLAEAYLQSVRARPVYAAWWNEHPDAHPDLPCVGAVNC